jgi:hypothetical protein
MGEGGVHNIAALAYYARSQADRTIRDYEIWISDNPIEWDTSGATLAGTGTWDSSGGYHSHIFDRRQNFRYLQLRQIYTSESPYGCVANVYLQTSELDAFPGLDTSILTAAYIRGKALLTGMDRSTTAYITLRAALEAAFAVLGDEALPEQNPINAQQLVDTTATTLLALLDVYDPPRKPPEVY